MMQIFLCLSNYLIQVKKEKQKQKQKATEPAIHSLIRSLTDESCLDGQKQKGKKWQN